ncbi:MAG: hypothetical protein ABIS35_00705 [Terracoccus sp.]
MPEAPAPGAAAHPRSADAREELVARLAAAATGTPGVVRLVPGLRAALARLRQPSHGASDDGITLVVKDDTADVVIDIGVDGTATVLDTALAVRAAAAGVLAAAHPGAHVIRVNVLSRDEADPEEGPAVAEQR